MDEFSGYKDPRWAEKRREILLRDSCKCLICGQNAEQVHHISYTNSNHEDTFHSPWLADNEQLVSLCYHHHHMFLGTKSKEYVFLPTYPVPTLLENPHDHMSEEFWSILDLMHPYWEDVYNILVKYQYVKLPTGLYFLGKKLLFAVLCPEHSLLWNKYYGLEPINDYDEVEVFCFYFYYISEELSLLDKKIAQHIQVCPSLEVNYNYVHRVFDQIQIKNKELPTYGVIVETVKNASKKQYSIKLSDISAHQTIIIDFSNDECFKKTKVSSTTLNKFGAIYAMLYLSARYGKVFHKYIPISVFLWNNTGIGGIRNLLYCDDSICIDFDKIRNELFPLHESLIDKLQAELKFLDQTKRYRAFEWNREMWGTYKTYDNIIEIDSSETIYNRFQQIGNYL